MAAYAALVSLNHIIEHIRNHPCPLISLDKEQVQSLTEMVMFLQEFLEGYSNINGGGSEDADVLESCIADVAYAAEDLIESHIVDTIHGDKFSSSSFFRGQLRKPIVLYDGLERVMRDLDLIRRYVADIKWNSSGIQDDDQVHKNYSMLASSLRRHSSSGHNTMVGFDDFVD
ncbi:hypothetical protein PHJA_002524600 [Phtheirospermum japonicum]|uniref:Rx N-terminal domain-containing protein n=1 Tax=Phtheirospermum japonicum TaxID=374723 RepID=A0A830CTB1_9LAMI|nr:hypothetical protein PHJA_002524600 [Phtheirospermum japonicum]